MSIEVKQLVIKVNVKDSGLREEKQQAEALTNAQVTLLEQKIQQLRSELNTQIQRKIEKQLRKTMEP